MIAESTILPMLPVVDIQRARKFYHEKLGLRIAIEDEMGILFEAGRGSSLYVYRRGPTKADHTAAAFEVDDIEAEVADLRRKGIRFEEYNIPDMGLKTVNGIASSRSEGYEDKTAWFKDTEGNILALHQRTDTGGRAAQRDKTRAGITTAGLAREDTEIYG